MAEGQPDYIETSDRLELVMLCLCLPCLVLGGQEMRWSGCDRDLGLIRGRAECPGLKLKVGWTDDETLCGKLN